MWEGVGPGARGCVDMWVCVGVVGWVLVLVHGGVWRCGCVGEGVGVGPGARVCVEMWVCGRGWVDWVRVCVRIYECVWMYNLSACLPFTPATYCCTCMRPKKLTWNPLREKLRKSHKGYHFILKRSEVEETKDSLGAADRS